MEQLGWRPEIAEWCWHLTGGGVYWVFCNHKEGGEVWTDTAAPWEPWTGLGQWGVGGGEVDHPFQGGILRSHSSEFRLVMMPAPAVAQQLALLYCKFGMQYTLHENNNYITKLNCWLQCSRGSIWPAQLLRRLLSCLIPASTLPGLLLSVLSASFLLLHQGWNRILVPYISLQGQLLSL